MKNKRYNMTIPQELYNALEEIAHERHTAVIEVIKQFMRLGLMVHQACKAPETSVILRINGRDRDMMLL